MVDIVLLGVPGAGKGTQCELLAKWLSLPCIATGELFRAAVEEQTELGLRAESYIDKGELVPDEITVRMMAERLARAECAQGVIFDGFPRTVAQAEALNTILGDLGRQVDVVLHVAVSQSSVLMRLSGRWICRRCGRAYHQLYNSEEVLGICDVCGGQLHQRDDDRPETQRRRLEVFLELTAPLLEFYRTSGILVEIDGEQDVAAVHRDLRQAIAAILVEEPESWLPGSGHAA